MPTPPNTVCKLWVSEAGRMPFTEYLTQHDFQVMGVALDYPHMDIALAARLTIRKNCMAGASRAYSLTREEACAILENSKTPPMFTEDNDGEPI